MNLTATVLFTCSQVCQEWNISKIVQPYQETLHVSRVDVLEVGGSTNSVLIDEVSKLKWSWHCVNQQTGYDLHRLVDAKRAAEWTIEHKPRVAWFRIRCCCWDGAENEQHFLHVWSGDQEHCAEQVMDFLVPLMKEEIVKVLQSLPRERIHERVAADVVHKEFFFLSL